MKIKIPIKRKIKDILKRSFFIFHKFLIRLGFHVIPVHFYSAIPNIIQLERNKEIWAKKSQLPGISINLDEQVNNLKTICLPFQDEFIDNKIYLEASSNYGLGFGVIEAQALYAVVRYYHPKKIIEVGSGLSTFCILKALEKNVSEGKQNRFHLTCIDPFPSSKLKEIDSINLVSKEVQFLSYDFFNDINDGDMLFIDSSHTVKPGSDVNYLILEILPRLRAGVIIHFHDIYLPFDYQRHILNTFFHWAETSLLRAFLINNKNAKILFCMSHLHYDRKEDLKKVFPDYNPKDDFNGLASSQNKSFETSLLHHFPSSIYIQIV